MRNDYATRLHSDDSDNSNSSKNSLKTYQQASACYKPEQGESNADAAERRRLIDERICEIKMKGSEGPTRNDQSDFHNTFKPRINSNAKLQSNNAERR
jgi:hypothetical protein